MFYHYLVAKDIIVTVVYLLYHAWDLLQY